MTLSVATSRAEMERLGASRDGWQPIQVTICGGGNGAHVAAGFLASHGIRCVAGRRGAGVGWAPARGVLYCSLCSRASLVRVLPTRRVQQPVLLVVFRGTQPACCGNLLNCLAPLFLAPRKSLQGTDV